MSLFSVGRKEESNESTDDKQPTESTDSSESRNGVGENDFAVGTADPKTSNARRVRTKSSRKKTGADNKQTDDTIQRKIVKAIQPPEISGDSVPQTDTSKDGGQDKDIDRDAKRYALPGKSPTAEGEAQRKLTDKARKERQDAAAFAKKKSKEEKLLEKRKAMPPSGQDHDGGNDTEQAGTDHAQQPKPRIFSVESEFPEHKRTVEKAALPIDSEPVEKKFKVDSEGDRAAGDTEKKWGLGLILPAAAFLAASAVMVMKFLKKK